MAANAASMSVLAEFKDAGTVSLFQKAVKKDYEGHKKKIHTVGWNSTGAKLASGSVDRTARIWTIDQTGKLSAPEMELKGHTDSIIQLAWSPANRDLLGTASADRTARLWDTRSGKQTFTHDTGAQGLNIAWTLDGLVLAVMNKKDVVMFFDMRTNKLIKQHKFHQEINEIAWHRSGQSLLVTSVNSIDIFKYPSMEKALSATAANLSYLSFDPAGRYLATGGSDAMVLLWDTSEMVPIKSFSKQDQAIRAVSFSYNSAYLASASEDTRICIYDVEAGTLAHTMSLKDREVTEINTLVWNPKSLLLAFAGDERSSRTGREGYVVSVWGFPS